MKFKKEIIAIILIICVLFTISAISAADSSQEVVSTANASGEVTGVSLDSDENLAIENDGEILGDGEIDGGTFADLNNKISGASEGETVYLWNDYEYSSTDSGTGGISISNSLTIDGQGHTIDAKGISRIFDCEVYGNVDVTLKNIIFTNAKASYGGAIYWYPDGGNTDIINCTFINNTASGVYGGGAAVYGYVGISNIVNCTFINNHDTNSALYLVSTNVENSIFLNNTNGIIVGSNVIANNNWFGSTIDNYATKPKVGSGVTMTSWYVLNITTNGANNLATISLNNLYDGSVINPSTTYALPSITFNVTGTNVTLNKNSITTDSNGDASFGFTVTEDTGILTASSNGISISKDVVDLTDDGSITALNNKIQQAINNGESEVKLYNDYVYGGDEAITNSLAKSNGNYVSNRGIGIGTDFTIDGQGFTITGKSSDSRIFYIRNDDSKVNKVTLKNINFVGCTEQYGSAVYATCNILEVINCTFTDNIANANPGAAIYASVSDSYLILNSTFTNNKQTSASASKKNGGAIALYVSTSTKGEIINSSFIGNSVNYRGGAIFLNNNNGGDDLIIDGCLFKDNTASDSGYTLYLHSTGTKSLSNSIILGTGNIILSDNSFSLDNNWWGSTVDDYSSLNIDAIYGIQTQYYFTINKYLYIDLSVDNKNGIATISLNNLNDGTTYDDYALPEITLNIESINANLNTNTVTLNEKGQAAFNYEMTGKIGTLKISYGDIELTKEIKMPIEGTFTSLVNDIEETEEDGTIDLSQDYHYNTTIDDGLSNGIEVTKSLTIDGHGFTIDGMGLSNIFYLNDDSKTLILKNIIFANATATNGAAVFFNGKKIEVENCTFINNTASSQGDAIYIVDATNGDNKITKSTFINNTGSNSVVYINLGSNDINVSNSIFMNNAAEYNIKASGNVIADYNWWANTNENYNSNIAKVDGTTVTRWLFLNITSADMDTGVATVSLNNLYDGSSVGSYGEYAIPLINITLGGEDATTRYDKIELSDNGQATYQFSMTKTNANLTVSYMNIITKKELEYIINDDGSFKALNDIIRFNDVIELTQNYTYSDSDTITDGIRITKTITIDGNGNTIDAKGNCGIFLVNSPNVIFKNIIFKNGIFQTGGAIYASQNADYLYVENCTFINNTATNTDGGAIWSGSYYFGSVVNCTFINNTAVEDGAAIFTYSYYTDAIIDHCLFINNSAPYTIMYLYYLFNCHDSIFLNNTANYIISGEYSSWGTLGNNWYGNTFDDYSNGPKIGMNNYKWLYLDIKFYEDYAVVSLNNLFSTSGVKSVATNYNLPEITLNVNSSTLNLETDTVTLGSTGQAIVPYTIDGETGALTVSWNGISLTKRLPEFDTLQTLMDGAVENSVIELDKDYTYTESDEITEGIIINKNITIDGKGHTIDAKEMTRIFNVQALNVTFKNIVFANGKSNLDYTTGKSNAGGAIYYNMDNTATIEFNVDNCTFINNTANDNLAYKYQGGAIFINSNEGVFNIKNSAFINNTATSDVGGAIYFNTKDSKFNLYNSSFIGNKAINNGVNGALYIKTDNGETTIDKCLFKESSISTASWSSAGSAIILDSTNENGNNVVKNSIFIDNNGNSPKNNNYVFLLKSGTVDIDDNWWGTTTNNNIGWNSYYTQGVTPNTWLFINSTVGKSKLQYNETTTITYSLQSYDGTDVADFDNSKLPEIEFGVECRSGELSSDVVSLNEDLTYRMTDAGSDSIDIYCNGNLYETWIHGPYIIPKVDVLYTIYANQNYININKLIETADGSYNLITVECNDSSLLNVAKPYINAHTKEGTAKLTFTYSGSSNYEAETYEMIVNVLKVPLTINVTNLESKEITLNVTDTLDLDISFEVDPIHKGYAPAWAILGKEYNSSVITFSYDDGERPDNASYYPTGHITAKAGGITNLTIFSTSDKFTWENYTIRITVNKIPTEVTFDDIDPLKVDDDGTISPIFFSNGTQTTATLVYESSDENVIQFISQGNFKAIGNGTATLTVKFNGNSTHEASSKEITVTVNKYDVGIDLNHEDSLTLNVSETSKINATLSDAEASGVLNYTSSNSSVVTVNNETGVLEAVGNGTAVITVYYDGDRKFNSASKTVSITVNKIESEISLTSTDSTPVYLQTITITPTVSAIGQIIDNPTVLYFIGDAQIANEFVVDRVGEFNITVKYAGNYKYLPSEKNITIVSSKADNTIEVTVSKDKAYPEEVTISLTSLVSGDYTVDINGTQVTITVPEGQTQACTTYKFGAGTYYANITSAPESEYYNQLTQNDTFSVAKGTNNAQIIIASENYLPGPVTVQVTGVKGTYVVSFDNGQTVNVTVENDGETGENSTYLVANDYTATLTLDNSNYTTTADAVQFSVIKSPNVVVVTVEDIYLPGTVTVKVKANATGLYTVKFNDTAGSEIVFEITTPNGETTNTITLPAGKYSANASAADVANYTVTITNDTFDVKKSDIELIIYVEQIVYGNNVTGYVKTNVSGTYTVKIADADPFTVECDGENQTDFNRNIPLIVADDYQAKISVDEQDYYNANSQTYLFDVVQTPTDFNATSTKEEYVYGEEVILNIELPDDAVGKVSFKYYNGTYIGEISDITQTQEFSMGIIDANRDYNIYANYSGDNNYKGLQKIISFKVNKADNYIKVVVIAGDYPDNATIMVNASVAGTYKVDINGEIYEVEANTTGLSHKFYADSYYANITYSDKNYNGITTNTTFTVNKGINEIKVEVTPATYPNDVIVRVIATLEGTYSVLINNETHAIVANGDGIRIKLAAGKYEANLTDYEIKNYIAQTENATFTVKKAVSIIYISVEDTTLPGNVTIKVESNIPGVYNVKINDTDVDVVVGDEGEGRASLYLDAGKSYYAHTTFSDYENYTVKITNATFDVVKGDNNIIVEVESVEYPNTVTVKVIADVAGTYTVDLNGTIVEIEANGTSDPIKLAAGDYYANVTGYESDVYNGIITNATFTVNKKVNNIKVTVEDTVLPGEVTVNVTADVDGIYTVDINGTLVNVEVISGNGSNKTSLSAGKAYHANTTFTHQNYTANITNATFDVNKAINNIKVEVIGGVEYPDRVTARVIADVAGIYKVDINGTQYNITANASWTLIRLAAGTYYANITGYDDPIYEANITNDEFEVYKKENNVKVIVENTVLPNEVTVNVTADADGIYTVDINGTEIKVNVTSGIGTNTTVLPTGIGYQANLTGYDGQNYTVIIENATFDVVKGNNNIVVEVESVEYPGEVIVKVTADVEGTYTVDVNGTIKDVVANGDGISLKLAAGTYYANIANYESDIYNGIITNATFAVNKKENNVKVIVEDTVLPDVVTVNVTADVDGIYTIDINGTTVDVNVTSGIGSNTTVLPAGKSYIATTAFDDNENYTVIIENATFDVDKADNHITVVVESVEYPGEVIVKVTADVEGTYTVDVNGTIVEIEANGTSDPIKLAAGTYYANITNYESDIYNGIIANATFAVNKKENNVKVIVEDTVLPDVVTVNVTADVDGIYTVDVNGTAVDVNVTSGIGSNTTALPPGKSYIATTSFDDNENYTVIIENATFDVNKYINNVKVEADGYVYGGVAAINITADVDGEYTVKINGTIIKVTVENGFGTNTTSLEEGSYTTSTEFVDDYCEAVVGEATFKVLPKEIKNNLTIFDAALPENASIEVSGEGNVTITVKYYLIKPDATLDMQILELYANGNRIKQLESVAESFIEVEFNIFETSAVEVYAVYKATDRENKDYEFTSNILTYDVSIFNSTVLISINETEYPENVTVEIRAGSDGIYIITCENKTYEANVTDGFASIALDVLPAGNYNVTVVSQANETIKNMTSFNVIKASDIQLDIAVKDNVMTITTPNNDNGNITININGVPYNATLINGSAQIAVDLYPGEYDVNVSYENDTNYNPIKDKNIKITVPKVEASVEDALNVTIPEGTTSPVISIELPEDAGGNLTVVIDGNETSVSVINGTASIDIGQLPVGDYNMTVTYSGDNKYASASKNTTLSVPKADIPENSTSIDVNIPKETTQPTFTISLPSDASGNLTVTVDGNKTYNATVINGTATVTAADLTVGQHNVTVSYSGDDKYGPITEDATFDVAKADVSETADINIDIPKASKSPVFKLSLPSDATGHVVVSVDGVELYAEVENGTATVSLGALSDGNHNITVRYSGDDKYAAIVKTTSISIVQPQLSAVDVSGLYTTVISYSVLVTNGGVPVSGENVQISFNGNLYNVLTDSNGYATFAVATTKIATGSYEVTATYQDVSITNKIDVKNIISVKNMVSKKSKGIKIKVVLKKVNGKYLKRKKVKIKLNGKVYSAKTNKKGVAIFKIKKYASRLKVGNKYIYKVAFGKDVVTKKIKIKR